MPRLQLFVCARGSSVDRFTNNLSIFELLEGVAPETYPALLPNLVAVSVFTKGPTEEREIYPFVLKVKKGKEVILRTDLNIDFQGLARSRSIATIQGILLVEPGTLEVCLSDSRGTVVGRYNIECRPGSAQAKAQLEQGRGTAREASHPARVARVSRSGRRRTREQPDSAK